MAIAVGSNPDRAVTEVILDLFHVPPVSRPSNTSPGSVPLSPRVQKIIRSLRSRSLVLRIWRPMPYHQGRANRFHKEPGRQGLGCLWTAASPILLKSLSRLPTCSFLGASTTCTPGGKQSGATEARHRSAAYSLQGRHLGRPYKDCVVAFRAFRSRAKCSSGR